LRQFGVYLRQIGVYLRQFGHYLRQFGHYLRESSFQNLLEWETIWCLFNTIWIEPFVDNLNDDRFSSKSSVISKNILSKIDKIDKLEKQYENNEMVLQNQLKNQEKQIQDLKIN
jgi:hypothetical protein